MNIYIFEFSSGLTTIIIDYSLQDLKLRQCYSDECLPGKPKVVFGSKGSTSDFYIRNKAYGDFLNDNFNATTADTASASVALVSKKTFYELKSLCFFFFFFFFFLRCLLARKLRMINLVNEFVCVPICRHLCQMKSSSWCSKVFQM
jgi:hypothetical protein